MMRLAPPRFDERLPAIMSDLGMIRYLGYSELPAAKASRAGSRPNRASTSPTASI